MYMVVWMVGTYIQLFKNSVWAFFVCVVGVCFFFFFSSKGGKFLQGLIFFLITYSSQRTCSHCAQLLKINMYVRETSPIAKLCVSKICCLSYMYFFHLRALKFCTYDLQKCFITEDLWENIQKHTYKEIRE